MTNPKFAIFEHIAELARVLGHANRLDLIEHVAQGERSVDKLAQITGLTVANVSQHLQMLRRAGFVVSRREGKNVFYRLAEGPIEPILAALRAHAEYSRAEVRSIVADYFTTLDAMEPVSRAELIARLARDEVTLLDVRPEEEYALGHVPGALNCPLSELDRLLSKLPQDREVVAYCRGPYCILSFQAVARLRERGFRVRRLEDGMPEWRAAGLAVEALA